jgi:hypothetical protein
LHGVGAGTKRRNSSEVQDLANPSFLLCRAQLLGGRTVGAGGPRICSHLGLPQPKWLNPAVEERLQGVNPCQSFPPQLLKVLTQGLYPAEVLPNHPLSLGGQGNRETTRKCGEQGGIIDLQEEPSFSPSLHRPGHVNLKVWIQPVPQCDMDDRASRGRQLHFKILWMVHMEEILPQIEIGVDPQVSFT